MLAPALKSRTFGHQRSQEPGSRKKGTIAVGSGLKESTSEEILQKRHSTGVLNTLSKSNSKEKNSLAARLGSAHMLHS